MAAAGCLGDKPIAAAGALGDESFAAAGAGCDALFRQNLERRARDHGASEGSCAILGGSVAVEVGVAAREHVKAQREVAADGDANHCQRPGGHGGRDPDGRRYGARLHARNRAALLYRLEIARGEELLFRLIPTKFLLSALTSHDASLLPFSTNLERSR